MFPRSSFLRRSALSFSVLAASLTATACQSHDTALLAVCEAPRNCTACKDASPPERSQLIAQYVEQHVRNDDVKALFSSLGSMSPTDRVAALRAAAEADGLAGCMLADQWAQSP